MKKTSVLHEYVRRGEPGYPFGLYRSHPFSCEHFHEEWEILYITHGTLSLCIGGTPYHETAGAVLIVNPNEIHSMRTETEDTTYLAFVFDPQMLGLAQDDPSQTNVLRPFTKGTLRFVNKPTPQTAVCEWLQQAAALHEARQTGYTLGVKGLLLACVATWIANGEYETIHLAENPSVQWIRHITAYVDEHLTERIALAQIAAECNVAPKYFCRMFKKHLHMPLMEYVNRKRVEYAAQLLTKTEDSVTDIALACGFSDVSYFTRTFKRFIEVTPTSYRASR